VTEVEFYERLRKERTDGTDLVGVVKETVNELLARDTDEHRPGMLLGKIQSGKTRAFLGVIAEAFDRGFDVAIVLTKGTRTLSQQTVRRIQTDFQSLRSDEKLEVYDIMAVPGLSAWEIDEQKLIFVAKKEANNMRRLLNLFRETHTALLYKRVLIIDDEADFASIRFTKKKGEQNFEQGRIADRIDELRRDLAGSAFLQVTATPYSLYLQPEEYPSDPEPTSPSNRRDRRSPSSSRSTADT
jgi:KaiC/GvpD/RAD55 family RecA-like ATPase